MGKIKMTCRQAEKLIPLYLSGELDTKELKDFARHMEQCTVCTEELSVQYLVAEGMNRLYPRSRKVLSPVSSYLR